MENPPPQNERRKKLSLFVRRVEAALFCLLAIFLVIVISVIAWRDYHTGQNIRIVSSSNPAFRVNLNRAAVQELMLLPGIGRARAERIVETRKSKPLQNLEDVRRITGMTEKQFQQVLPLVKLE